MEDYIVIMEITEITRIHISGSGSVTHTHGDDNLNKPDTIQQFNLLYLEHVCVQNFHQKVFIANFLCQKFILLVKY